MADQRPVLLHHQVRLYKAAKVQDQVRRESLKRKRLHCVAAVRQLAAVVLCEELVEGDLRDNVVARAGLVEGRGWQVEAEVQKGHGPGGEALLLDGLGCRQAAHPATADLHAALKGVRDQGDAVRLQVLAEGIQQPRQKVQHVGLSVEGEAPVAGEADGLHELVGAVEGLERPRAPDLARRLAQRLH